MQLVAWYEESQAKKSYATPDSVQNFDDVKDWHSV